MRCCVKKVYLVLMLFSFSVLLFSEGTSFQNMDFMSKIDYISNSINTMNPDFIDEIYNYNKSDPDYESLIEILVEKAGDLVFQKEYGYAFQIIEGVLYNNLDHVQAQELYLILNDILKEEAEQKRIQLEAEEEKERLRLEAEAEQERVRLEEEERLRQEVLAEEERIRLAQEKETLLREEENQRIAEKQAREDEYQENLLAKQKQLAEAEAYKSSIITIGAKNFSFYTFLFPGELLYYISEVNTQYNSGDQQKHILYGSAFQGGINFTHPMVNVNLDMDVDFGYVGINSTGSRNINYSITASIGSPALFIPLSFRAGFFYNQYFYDNESSTDMAIIKLPTPSLGIGLWNLILFDKFKIDCDIDYYLVSFLTDQLDLAFSGELAVSYRIFQFNSFSIYTSFSSHAFFLKEADMYESNINGKIGLGISYNE